MHPFTTENLFRILSNEKISPDEVQEHRQARYLSRYLADLEARSIVVEEDYTDGDYLDDFAEYYVRCWTPYQRRCRRLHFFDIELDDESLREILLDSRKHSRLQDPHYLGFVVARPLPSAIIGRSVLKTYPSDGGRRHYPATGEYRANLLGTELRLESLAFQEQDTVLAACATVSLWSAFHQTARLFGTPTPTPTAITRSANTVVHRVRAFPSQGLTFEQISYAIQDVGLQPEEVDVDSATPLASLAYAYLRSQLPVILIVRVEGVGDHAVTLAGYSLKDRRVLDREVGPNEQTVRSIGLRIDELYGHDDQVGPFARMPIRPHATVGPREFPVVLEGWTDESGASSKRLLPLAVVVPVYHKIRLSYIDVHKILMTLDWLLDRTLLPGRDAAEWDAHLITTNEYKQSIHDQGGRYPEAEDLLTYQHPRFIWRAVLRDGKGQTLLEILIDATDMPMPRSFPVYRLVWHKEAFREDLRQMVTSSSMESLLKRVLSVPFLRFLQEHA